MLDTISLSKTCSKKEYNAQVDDVQFQLFTAQQECIRRGIPLLVIIAGVPGTGRGGLMNLLSSWFDAKFARNYIFWQETDEERERPEEWRYWRCMPGAGRVALFYDGWYGLSLRRRCCGKMSEAEFKVRMAHWQDIEASLSDSGMAIVKIWLHLDRKTYESRLKDRLHGAGPKSFTPRDKKILGHYKEYVKAASDAITMTDTANAPWTVIDASDANYRNLAVARAIIAGVSQAEMEQDARKARLEVAETTSAATGQAGNMLASVDLTLAMEHSAYLKELTSLQLEIRDLSFKAYRRGISSTLIFEGWDAAGKGGAIRRLTAAMDARYTRIFPIAAPTAEEKAHHYLWRFWRHIPRAGFITIYDRSWYGRVMVERVERFTPREDWSRAYAEINDFEQQLIDGRNILLKFWLHISPDEQLRRFKERQETPRKQYKITDEDWRNRDKWQDYEVAVEEMFRRTHTSYAPWTVVPAEDKKFARVMVLRTYADALRLALDQDRKSGKGRN